VSGSVLFQWADNKISENEVLVEITRVFAQKFVQRVGTKHRSEKSMRSHRPQSFLPVSRINGKSAVKGEAFAARRRLTTTFLGVD
jgi:hypothetical protein